MNVHERLLTNELVHRVPRLEVVKLEQEKLPYLFHKNWFVAPREISVGAVARLKTIDDVVVFVSKLFDDQALERRMLFLRSLTLHRGYYCFVIATFSI